MTVNMQADVRREDEVRGGRCRHGAREGGAGFCVTCEREAERAEAKDESMREWARIDREDGRR